MCSSIIYPEGIIITPYTSYCYVVLDGKILESVRIHHKPIGTTIAPESEITHHKNRHLALEKLEQELIRYEEDLCWQEYNGKVHEWLHCCRYPHLVSPMVDII